MLESVVVRNKLKLISILFCFFSVELFAQAETNKQTDKQTDTQVSTQTDAQKDAQADTQSASSKAPKKIVIQFDNELVDGKRESPELDYLFSRKEANYKKMMKLRDNFLPEVKKGKRDFSGSK